MAKINLLETFMGCWDLHGDHFRIRMRDNLVITLELVKLAPRLQILSVENGQTGFINPSGNFCKLPDPPILKLPVQGCAEYGFLPLFKAARGKLDRPKNFGRNRFKRYPPLQRLGRIQAE